MVWRGAVKSKLVCVGGYFFLERLTDTQRACGIGNFFRFHGYAFRFESGQAQLRNYITEYSTRCGFSWQKKSGFL